MRTLQLVLLLVVTGSVCAQRTGAAPALVDAVLKSAQERTGGTAVGLAMSWVHRGKPFLEGAIGKARADYEKTAPGLPMTAATVVPGGSTGKAVTAATLLLALREVGADADECIVDFLPDGLADYGEHVAEITFAQLLSHTSGFDFRDLSFRAPVEPKVRKVLAGGTDRPPGGDPALPLWSAGRGAPPASHEGPVYSNINYGTARVLVEKLTDQSFEDAALRLVVKPLGLDWSLDAEPEPRALGYTRFQPNTPGSRWVESYRGWAGAGGWHTSARGLALGVRGFVHGDGFPGPIRSRMLEGRMGIFGDDLAGCRVWFHDGVQLHRGRRGFEVAMAAFADDLNAGLVVNTFGNYWISNVVRQLWSEFVPKIRFEGSGATRSVALACGPLDGTIRWRTDDGALAEGEVFDGPIELAAGTRLRCAVFRDDGFVSFPISRTVPGESERQ